MKNINQLVKMFEIKKKT